MNVLLPKLGGGTSGIGARTAEQFVEERDDRDLAVEYACLVSPAPGC